MSTISPPIQVRAAHLTTEEVDAAVRGVLRSRAATAGARTNGHPVLAHISPACAVTIASWYQSPTHPGRELSALASGMAVGRDALLADVEATLAEVQDRGPVDRDEDHDADLECLQLLRDWVEAQP